VTASRAGKATEAISHRRASVSPTIFRRTVYLRTVQDWIVRPQMKTVPGADAIGGFVKQYQVQPDPQKLVAYGLSFPQVVAGHRSQ